LEDDVLVPIGLTGDWDSEIPSDYDSSNEDQYMRLAPVAMGRGNMGVNTNSLFPMFSERRPNKKLIKGAEKLQELHTSDLLEMREKGSLGYVHKGGLPLLRSSSDV
jgi:hypothetical protein